MYQKLQIFYKRFLNMYFICTWNLFLSAHFLCQQKGSHRFVCKRDSMCVFGGCPLGAKRCCYRNLGAKI